jgi:hypothetical protein
MQTLSLVPILTETRTRGENMDDEQYQQKTDEAREYGRQQGEAAASWFFDGNTEEETVRAVLRGIEDGDPVVLDRLPYCDLSGQWADEPVPTTVLNDLGITVEQGEEGHGFLVVEDYDEVSDIVAVYEDSFNEGMVLAVEKDARDRLGIPDSMTFPEWELRDAGEGRDGI